MPPSVPITAPSLLTNYPKPEGVWDEMMASDGSLRPHYQRLAGTLNRLGPAGLAACADQARRSIAENGVTYNVYGDPRGMDVLGDDGRVAGTVCDVWVDRSEVLVRYFEVALKGTQRTVLLPFNMSRVDGGRRQVKVKSIHARHLFFHDSGTSSRNRRVH